MAGVRMTVVWCPDWPVVSWGVPLDEPAAVLVANRVVATTPAARANGVALGQRRRDAQGRCPELAVLDRDIDREARLFEPVAAALDAITPRVEVTGPGLVGFPTRGPSRFFGGDRALAEKTVELIEPVLARRVPVRVAIADGVFAARLAARAARSAGHPDDRQAAGFQTAIRVIDRGDTPNFLAGLPIATLEMPDLTEVFVRLGLTTLGSLAELSAADIVGRFGSEGRLAHRLAQGEDDHPPDLRRPAPDLAVTWMFEPPAEVIERCAFAAKTLADELHHDLLTQGLSCTRVAIEAETESGERQMRLWRHQGTLSAAALADRARWQLDGWLNQGENSRPSSGIARLTLIPDEVVAASGRQLGLWGARNDRCEDVTRVVARLQAMLGPDAVTVPEYRGGIGPGEQLRMVPAAVVDLAEERPATSRRWVAEPWPGQVPPPSPARIHPDPLPVDLVDGEGRTIGVSGRGELSGEPHAISGDLFGSRRTVRRIVKWAGPWPAAQRWWDPLTQRRRARLQVVLDDQSAHLLTIEQQLWSVEA
ncbi:MAG: DNA polymerase Y family protein, partial [Acidimicrobiales bacterium]